MANAQNQTDEQAKAAADEKAKQEAEAQAAAEAKEKQEAEIAALVDARVAEALANQAAQNTTVAVVPGGVAESVTTSTDETIPGGRYLVNGKFVDCNGKPIKGAKSEDGE